MKNVLFIGPYRQRDGWGRASRDYLKALSKTKFNVSSKPIFMAASVDEDVPSYVEKLENTVLKARPDVVIQNALPHYFDYQADCHNIGISYFETAGWKPIGWANHINLLDEMWVSSETEKQILLNDGVNVPVSVVPMPIDMDWLNPEAEPLKLPEMEDCYVFYFLGEKIYRKNIMGLVLAFHREFARSEPVKLVIKTSKLLRSAEDLSSELQGEILDLKKKMRLYASLQDYHREFIITDFLSEAELNGLHVLGDCLVIPSRGESLSRPVMEAMVMGNQVVVTDNTPMSELTGNAGLHIDSHEVPVVVSDFPLRQLYTSHETWQEPNIISMQKQMRAAYEMSEERKGQRKEALQKRIQNYTHDSIAKLMEGKICHPLET